MRRLNDARDFDTSGFPGHVSSLGRSRSPWFRFTSKPSIDISFHSLNWLILGEGNRVKVGTGAGPKLASQL